jgi:hypothetical protein
MHHKLTKSPVFYHLDYLSKPQQPPAAVFRHRLRSNERRRLPKKFDLSHIEDPLMALAEHYAPGDPLTPPASSSSEAAGSLDMPEGKLRSPEVRPATPPLDSDLENDSDAMTDEEEELEDSHLVLHTRVYALAEKYDIPSLKQLARSKFEMAMACFYDSPNFAEAIEEVYCSTIDSDRGLRDIVLEAFKSHPQLASTQDVYNVIKETPSLAFELFKVERGIPV